MKAPDKIYLHGYEFNDEPCKTREREPKVKGMRGYPAKHAEYIRKDALLEWAEKKIAKGTIDEWDKGYVQCLKDLIEKLESL